MEAAAPPYASQHFTDAVLGTVVMGWTAQLIFYGFACSSFLAYLDSKGFQHDSTSRRVVLFTVMVFLSLQSAISLYSIWHYSTWQLRDEDTLYAQTLADCFATGPVAVVGALVQSFLAHRASSLFNNRIARISYRIFIYLCISTAFFGAILYIALSFLDRAGKSFPAKLGFGVAVGIWLWSNASIDIIVCTTLIVVLRKRIMHFNSTTDTVLRRLMRLAVQTAIVPAVLAVCGAAMAFSFSNDDNSIYTNAAGSFYQPLSSLYAISLIATLASRAKLSEETLPVPHISTISNSFSPYMTHSHQPTLCRSKSDGGRAGVVGSGAFLGVRADVERRVEVDRPERLV